MRPLKDIHKSLQSLNGFQNMHPLMDFIKPTKGDNKILIKEENDEAEVIVLLNADLLERIRGMSFPKDFSMEMIPDLSVLIEELSHFNTYCEKALVGKNVSGLELEVQGEVDKFGIILEWLDQRNEERLRHEVFDSLFETLTLGEWVPEEKRERYEQAHIIARNFCRKVLQGQLASQSRRKVFKSFFELSAAEKLSCKS